VVHVVASPLMRPRPKTLPSGQPTSHCRMSLRGSAQTVKWPVRCSFRTPLYPRGAGNDPVALKVPLQSLQAWWTAAGARTSRTPLTTYGLRPWTCLPEVPHPPQRTIPAATGGENPRPTNHEYSTYADSGYRSPA
jgi:hypothetical protein